MNSKIEDLSPKDRELVLKAAELFNVDPDLLTLTDGWVYLDVEESPEVFTTKKIPRRLYKFQKEI